METVRQIAQFVRWRDWGPGKLTILWSLCLYIAIAYELNFSSFILTSVIFLIFAATQSALGYVLNEWGDRELDRRQFKHNSFTGKSSLECMLALTLILVAAAISGLPLALRPGFGMLWLAWAASAAAYSLEPFRLKTRGLVGLPVSFVAQWFLPVLITFAAFGVGGGRDMWLLALALTISGATLEIGHQRFDRMRDMLTRAATFAAGMQDVAIDRLYAAALLLDKFSIGLVVALVVTRLASLPARGALFLAILLGSGYILLLFFTLGASIRALRGGDLEDPYYSREPIIARLLHETLLNFGVPLVLGIAAALNDPYYAILLGVFLVWRVGLSRADWLWPLRAVRVKMNK